MEPWGPIPFQGPSTRPASMSILPALGPARGGEPVGACGQVPRRVAACAPRIDAAPGRPRRPRSLPPVVARPGERARAGPRSPRRAGRGHRRGCRAAVGILMGAALEEDVAGIGLGGSRSGRIMSIPSPARAGVAGRGLHGVGIADDGTTHSPREAGHGDGRPLAGSRVRVGSETRREGARAHHRPGAGVRTTAVAPVRAASPRRSCRREGLPRRGQARRDIGERPHLPRDSRSPIFPGHSCRSLPPPAHAPGSRSGGGWQSSRPVSSRRVRRSDTPCVAVAERRNGSVSRAHGIRGGGRRGHAGPPRRRFDRGAPRPNHHERPDRCGRSAGAGARRKVSERIESIGPRTS